MSSHRCFSHAVALAAISSLALLCRPAAATEYAITETGVLTYVNDNSGMFTGLQVGDTYTVTFYVNDAYWSGGPGVSNYLSHSVLEGCDLQLGAHSVGSDPHNPQTNYLALEDFHSGISSDSSAWDMIQNISDGLSGPGFARGVVFSELDGTNNDPYDPLTSPLLPLTGPGVTDLSQWDLRSFSFEAYQNTDHSGNFASIQGDIETLNATVTRARVPEPSEAAVFSLGALAVFGLLFRARKNRVACP